MYVHELAANGTKAKGLSVIVAQITTYFKGARGVRHILYE